MNLLEQENLRVAGDGPFVLGLERAQGVFRSAVDHLDCADWLGAPAVQLARKLLAGGGRAGNQDRDVNPCGKADIFFGCQRRRRSRLRGLHQMPGTFSSICAIPPSPAPSDTSASGRFIEDRAMDSWVNFQVLPESTNYRHKWTGDPGSRLFGARGGAGRHADADQVRNLSAGHAGRPASEERPGDSVEAAAAAAAPAAHQPSR